MKRCFIASFLPALAVLALVALPASTRAASGTWLLNPANNNWDNNANWTGATYPQAAAQTATFDLSNLTDPHVTINTTVGSIVFNSNAASNPFTITVNQSVIFNVSGAGVTNNSGATQNFVLDAGNTYFGEMDFFNSATAGTMTAYDLKGSTQTGTFDSAFLLFHDTSTAGSAKITNEAETVANCIGAETQFRNSSSAGDALIINNGAAFADTAAGMEVAAGGFTTFYMASTAGNATLVANAGSVAGGGGAIFFANASDGGTSRVEVFGGAGPGYLDISFHPSGGVNIGSLEGDGNVFLGSGTLRVGTNNMDTVFSGVIQDGGKNGGTGGLFAKLGTGTLQLDGANTHTGGTRVNDGTLVVNNYNALGNGNVLLHDGTLETLDNSSQSFYVANNYRQEFGTIRFQIGGLNSGFDSDLMQVNNTAFLSQGDFSSPFIQRINNFSPLPGDMVEIITANNVVNEWDSTPNNTIAPNDFPGLIQPYIIYDPSDVFVDFELSNTFESQGLTRNQMAVGAALDNAVLDNCVPRVISFVGNEPLVNLPYDYDLIAPEELASIYEMGFTQANMQGVNLMQRMDDIRAGSTGFCSSVAMEMPAPSYSKESDGKEVLNKNPVPAFVPTPENRWGIWATGSGQFVNVGGDDDNATGYDLSNGNFTVGIDYRLLHNLAFGIYGGYDAGVANLVNDGRITTNGGNVGGFATWSWDRFYVDVSGGGTWNNYKTRRTALLGDAVGSTKGSQYNVLGALGYDWHFGCWNIGPRATFQYTDVTIDQFRERGSLAPLNFPDQNEDSLQSTVGVRASYDLHPSKTVIIRPELNVAWLHEYNDRAYPIDAGFIGCPGGFTVYGPNVGRDGAQVRAGASAQLNPAFAIYVYYDGLLGRGNYSNNGASGGFTWSF